jgi:transposase
MKKERRKFSAAFKAKVALEAIKEKETLQQLSSKFEVHQNQIAQWKREFLERAEDVFDKKKTETKSNDEQEKEMLYGKIGRLQTQVDFLKKVLGK